MSFLGFSFNNDKIESLEDKHYNKNYAFVFLVLAIRTNP